MNHVTRLFDIPRYQLEKFPQENCFSAKEGGKWVSTSTSEYVERADAFSRGLVKLGIKPGDRIVMISNNRPEWNIADIGIQQAGAINVPVYPNISSKDYEYIFNDAEVVMCIVSDQELLDKVEQARPNIPTLKSIYSFDKLAGVHHWSEIMDEDMTHQEEVERRMAEIKPDDLATMIYTSGTTGNPKGVMLSHNNILSNAKACIPRLPVDSNAVSLSFLPVCHIYERMLLYLYQIVGVSVYYAESLETIGDNLKEVKPDVFTAVPRLLEKVYGKIMDKGHALTGIKKSLFFWAVGLAEEYEIHGKSGWYKFKLSIARKLIFSKWQEALGGNCKAVASGSAALQPRLCRVFLAAGIPIMEGYGLTETSPVVSVNCEDQDGVRIGSVGRPIDGVQVNIAEDGEILVKGPNVMLGYYNQPEKTAEVMDQDGWFHTGDIGEFNNGFLRITDRKKEIFKTSGGKYIIPQVMENTFKESPFIEQIMVIGEGEKHPSAFVVPAADYIKTWAKRKGHDIGSSRQDMVENEHVIKAIKAEVERINGKFGQWEKVKKFELLAEEWSVETGELTPTLKLRRKPILKKYASTYEKIYGRGVEV